MTRLAAVLAVLLASSAFAQPKPVKPQAELDRSIKKALEFLAKSQNDDGTWSVGQRGTHPTVSALAVLAFLSAGHVPGEGPHGPVVDKGIRAVMKLQRANGLFAFGDGHEMYHHGICTLLLAEVVGLKKEPLAKEARKCLDKALKVVLVAQRKGADASDVSRGGWRYRVVGKDADLSVTGWQVLVLHAAKNVGCDVPAEVIDKAVDFVKRLQRADSGAFGYTPNGGVTIACTGVGILALSLCSDKRPRELPEAVQGGNFLLKLPLIWDGPHFFYAIYFCSRAMFQLGDPQDQDKKPADGKRLEYWSAYREKLHAVLFKNQTEMGSWPGNSGYGPVYGTSMAVLALTVEYRHLPSYQVPKEPSEKK